MPTPPATLAALDELLGRVHAARAGGGRYTATPDERRLLGRAVRTLAAAGVDDGLISKLVGLSPQTVAKSIARAPLRELAPGAAERWRRWAVTRSPTRSVATPKPAAEPPSAKQPSPDQPTEAAVVDANGIVKRWGQTLAIDHATLRIGRGITG